MRGPGIVMLGAWFGADRQRPGGARFRALQGARPIGWM